MRERAAHALAAIASTLGPWWRFRVWARLVGTKAYASFPDEHRQVRALWPHGYRMALSSGDWMERYAIAAGRFYQDELSILLLQELQQGDTFVDIGANLGFVTLTAARRVGPSGKVHAFEADPETSRRLQTNVELNGLTNVKVHNTALGDRAGSVSLVRETSHHGTNYIGPETPGSEVIPMLRGDDALGEVGGRVLVKIDVEGAERLVLDGLSNLLKRPDIRFIVEISKTQLARFHTSPDEIFSLMAAHGYRAFAVSLPFIGSQIRLRRLDRPAPRPLYDVLFARA